MESTHTHKTRCDICLGAANPANFGDLCDPCTEARIARSQRVANLLKAKGQMDTDLGRALRHRAG